MEFGRRLAVERELLKNPAIQFYNAGTYAWYIRKVLDTSAIRTLSLDFVWSRRTLYAATSTIVLMNHMMIIYRLSLNMVVFGIEIYQNTATYIW